MKTRQEIQSEGGRDHSQSDGGCQWWYRWKAFMASSLPPLFPFPLSSALSRGWYDLADYKTPLPCVSLLSVPGWGYRSHSPGACECVSGVRKQGWRKRRSEQEREEGSMNESVCEIRAGKLVEAPGHKQHYCLQRSWGCPRGKCRRQARAHTHTHIHVLHTLTDIVYVCMFQCLRPCRPYFLYLECVSYAHHRWCPYKVHVLFV